MKRYFQDTYSNYLLIQEHKKTDVGVNCYDWYVWSPDTSSWEHRGRYFDDKLKYIRIKEISKAEAMLEIL